MRTPQEWLLEFAEPLIDEFAQQLTSNSLPPGFACSTASTASRCISSACSGSRCVAPPAHAPPTHAPPAHAPPAEAPPADALPTRSCCAAAAWLSAAPQRRLARGALARAPRAAARPRTLRQVAPAAQPARAVARLLARPRARACLGRSEHGGVLRRYERLVGRAPAFMNWDVRAAGGGWDRRSVRGGHILQDQCVVMCACASLVLYRFGSRILGECV